MGVFTRLATKPPRLAAGWPWLLSVLALAAGGVGCGLLDVDSFRYIEFQIPRKSYRLTIPGERLPASMLPAIPCGPSQPVTDCCMPGAGTGLNCAQYPLVCDAGTCAHLLPIENAQRVDLKQEVPALAKVGTPTLSEVILENIEYELKSSLNVPLPPIDIYVAPADATSVTTAARKIVTIPMHPAGADVMNNIVLDAEQRRAFSDYARDLGKPFSILTATTVKLAGGMPVPQGEVNVTVTGRVKAKP